jgi:RNA polymerase sigma-70 factor (ECF subfamily)
VQSETWREPTSTHIQPAVQKRHHEAQQTFPDVRLDLQAFVQKVVAVLEKHLPQRSNEAEFNLTQMQFLDNLRWEELFLTTACALGDEAAWKTFHSRYHAVIQKAARYCAENNSEAQELSDSLMSDLFLPISTESGKKTNKVGQYDGLGSLEGWIKVVIARQSIDRIRAQKKQVAIDDLEVEPPSLDPSARADSSILEHDEQQALQMVSSGLAEALRRLDPQQKIILQLYYLQLL